MLHTTFKDGTEARLIAKKFKVVKVVKVDVGRFIGTWMWLKSAARL
ncbi:hypothetical protein [Hydrogenophaga sp.]